MYNNNKNLNSYLLYVKFVWEYLYWCLIQGKKMGVQVISMHLSSKLVDI